MTLMIHLSDKEKAWIKRGYKLAYQKKINPKEFMDLNEKNGEKLAYALFILRNSVKSESYEHAELHWLLAKVRTKLNHIKRINKRR